MRRAGLVVVVGFLMLHGCVTVDRSAREHSVDLVAVSDIVGGIKCAFATALEVERGSEFKRLEGRVVQIELSLKLVDESAYGGRIEAKATGPFVFAAAGGVGSILPKLTGSVNRTNTIETTIRSRLGLVRVPTTVCSDHLRRARIDYGFTTWLANVVGNLNDYGDRPPSGIVDDITYDGSFQIVRKRSAGVDFDVVFVGGSASANADRNDVQHIRMVIQYPSKEVPFPTAAYRHPTGAGRVTNPDLGGAGPLSNGADARVEQSFRSEQSQVARPRRNDLHSDPLGPPAAVPTAAPGPGRPVPETGVRTSAAVPPCTIHDPGVGAGVFC